MCYFIYTIANLHKIVSLNTLLIVVNCDHGGKGRGGGFESMIPFHIVLSIIPYTMSLSPFPYLSLTLSLSLSLSLSLTHSLTHSFTHSLTHPLTHSLSLSLTLPLTLSFSLSLSPSLYLSPSIPSFLSPIHIANTSWTNDRSETSQKAFFVICGDGMCMWINSNCKQMYLWYVHIFWNKYGLSWTSKPIYSLCTCVDRHVCNGILQNQSTLLLLYLPLRLLLYLSFLGTEHYYNFFIEEISSIFYITNVKRDISYCRVKNTNKPSSGVGVFNCNRSCNELGTSWPK